MVVAELAVSIAERNFSDPHFLRVFLSALRKSTGSSSASPHGRNTLRCVDRGATARRAAQSETGHAAEESQKIIGGFTPQVWQKIVDVSVPVLSARGH
jgi:hypothetical protein